jgi:tetratricopeptide (TPR) repeat protein
MGVLLLATIVLAYYAFKQRNEATDARHQAEEARQDAQDNEQRAVRAAQEAEQQRQRAISAMRAAQEADQKRQVADQQLQVAALLMVSIGRELAKLGAIRDAKTVFDTVQASFPNLAIAAADWNSLCWFGSLGGFATDVMTACNKAVALEPNRGNFRDSRGVARALTGDYPGAIEDFQRFLEWGSKNGVSEERLHQRQDWIRMLQANQNPFNKELLKLLRNR